MNKRLFLIDGHALVFKMYYAFLRHPMINSKGADMSILFGFTKYILELIEREKPTHFAVAFDPPGGTFRHEMYPEYNIAKHKGYPTKEHMDAVRKYGPSPIHRMSFLGFLNKDEK